MYKKLSSCIIIFGVVFLLAFTKTTTSQTHKHENHVTNFSLGHGNGYKSERHGDYGSYRHERRGYDRDDYYRGDRDDRYERRGDWDDRYERHERHERHERAYFRRHW